MAPEAGDSIRRRAVARASGTGAACGDGAESRNADAARCRRAILTRCAGSCSFSWSLRSLLPAAIAPKRIAAAFDWHGVVSPANYRIDAWVTPPAYTGRPPLILPGLRPGEQSQARAHGPVTVPAGSTLVVRATGQSGLDIAVKGGIAEAQAEAKPQAPKGTEERHFTITAAGTATVKGGGDDVVWTFNAIPDRPPTIALAKEPEPQLRGSLLLNYKLEDDYGVVDAQATFERKTPRAGGERAKPPRPLFDAPDFTLVLPQARTRDGAGQTTKDLSEHPWAGVDVAMTLVARDEANNEGRSTRTRCGCRSGRSPSRCRAR